MINDLRAITGRLVEVHVEEGRIACSGCSLDPVTDESTDSFCTVCDGLYWIPVISGYSISGHVRWGSADQPMYTPGGNIPEGECKVTVQYTANNLRYVEDGEYWVVDGKTLYMKNFKLKGIRGNNEEHEPNRIAVRLIEEES